LNSAGKVAKYKNSYQSQTGTEFLYILTIVLLFCAAPTQADFINDMLSSTVDAQRQGAMVNARHGRFDQALKQIDTALQKSNNDPDILCNKILILYMADRPLQALEALKQLPPKYQVPGYLTPVIGKLYYLTGKNSQALNYFDKALTGTPNNQELIRSYFDFCIATEDLKDASRVYDHAVKNSPSRQWVKDAQQRIKHLQGIKAARLGKYEEAEQLLNEAAAANPGDIKISYDRVVVAAWAGNQAEAIRRFTQLPPQSDPPYYVLIDVARAYWRTDNPLATIDCCRRALKLNPQSQAACDLLLSAMLRTKDIEGIIKFIKDYPETAKRRQSEIIQILHDEGVSLARAGKYAEGERLLETALSLNRNNPQIQYDRIVVAAWANRYRDALEYFEALPANTKVPPYVLPEIARSYQETNQAEKAIVYYRKLLQSEPNRKDAATALIALLATTPNHLDEARKLVSERISKYPEEAKKLSAIIAEGLKKRAVLEARDNHLPEALKYIREAVKINNGSLDIMFDYIAILSWNGLDKEAIDAYRQLPPNTDCPIYTLRAVARSYENLGMYDQALEIYEKILKKDSRSTEAGTGVMRIHIKTGRIDAALAFVEKRRRLLGKDDPAVLTMLGNAFLDAGKPQMAKPQYQKALQSDHNYLDASIGLSRVLVKERQWKDAEKIIDNVLHQKPRDIPALYVKAEILEAKSDYMGSCQYYDRIAALPGGERAVYAKYRVLNSIGASGRVLEMIADGSPRPPPDLYTQLLGDQAASKVPRNDPLPAIANLERNMLIAAQRNDPQFLSRSRYDHITAERQAEDMKKVLAEYEKLIAEKQDPPYWVKEAAADAYTYFQKPDIALKLYRQVEKQREAIGINKYPDNFNLRLAIYYTLLDLERFSEAGKILDGLEKDTAPPPMAKGKKPPQDWNRVTVMVERVWWLIFQDRLGEAETKLRELARLMPYNTNIISAQAYLHYYRGWPRRALQEFQLANTLDPGRQEQVGLAYALDENGEEKQARKIASDLAKKYPEDTAVKKLNRALEIEDMRTDSIDFTYSQEQAQSDGFTLSHRLEQPIEPNRKVYVETIWKHVMKGGLEDDTIPNTAEVFRNGFGVDWEVYRDLTLRGGASIDYQGKFPAGSGGFDYRIDDHWTLAADYTNYSLNAPGWVYLDGSHAQEYTTSVRYRESEDFNADFNFGQMFISADNNIRSSWSARQDKALAHWAHWTPRLAFEESVTSDSVVDVNYYASRCNIYLYTVPYLEHIWYRYYETVIMDRVYVAPGIQVEDQYSPKFAGYLKYEQEWKLNDRFSFKAGITGTRRNYDGEGSYGFAVDTGVVCHF